MNTNFNKFRIFLESTISEKTLKSALLSGYALMFENGSMTHSQTFLSKFPISKELADNIHNYALESIDCVELKHGDDPDYEFDVEELKRGIAVEQEHTNNPTVAEKIAKAHLVEDPNYYKKLSKLGL